MQSNNSKAYKGLFTAQNLDFKKKKIEVGYNAGQFHHGTGKTRM